MIKFRQHEKDEYSCLTENVRLNSTLININIFALIEES